MNDVLDQADNNNDLSAVISSNSFSRTEQLSYPGKSLREIILNAFAHANYFIRSNIKIEFFDKEVRVTNPGGIYKATLEDILDKGIQTYRNPGLINILNKLHFIENFTTGIPRTFEAYDKYNVKPNFNPSESFFSVTLPNVNYYEPIKVEEQKVKTNINLSSSLTDLDLLILKTIKEHPGINGLQI